MVVPGEEHGVDGDVGEFFGHGEIEEEERGDKVNISSLRRDRRRMPHGKSREIVIVFDSLRRRHPG